MREYKNQFAPGQGLWGLAQEAIGRTLLYIARLGIQKKYYLVWRTICGLRRIMPPWPASLARRWKRGYKILFFRFKSCL